LPAREIHYIANPRLSQKAPAGASGGQRKSFEKVSLWNLFKTFHWSSRENRCRDSSPDAPVKMFKKKILMKTLS